MRARMVGTHGRVVQNGIGVAHVFLLTRVLWAEPSGSVYFHGMLSLSWPWCLLQSSKLQKYIFLMNKSAN